MRSSRADRCLVIGALLLAACGSPGSGVRSDGSVNGATPAAVNRAYLVARREARSCPGLREAADAAFTNKSHGPALDADELLIAFCPTAKLDAVEQTQVMLARTEARSGGEAARSVRLRLTMPLPAGHRLMWFGAYADRMMGLNNLTFGTHRIEVELHIWHPGPSGDSPDDGQMLRVASAIDVNIDGRTPVVLDAALTGGAGPGQRATGLAAPSLTLTPGGAGMPAGATTGMVGTVDGSRGTAPSVLAQAKIPFPDPPQPLARVGLPSSIDLELCFDAGGRVSRVDPQAWPHPRYLASYVEGLRSFRMRPYVVNGVPVPFCTGWRQIVEQPVQSISRM